MSKQSKNSKNQKKKGNSGASEPDPLEDKPKASKFFVPDEENDEDDETNDKIKIEEKPVKSKFFAEDKEPKVKLAPKSKFFQADDDEENDESIEKQEVPKKIEEKKPAGSKFFQADNDEEEEPEEKPQENEKSVEKPKVEEKSKKNKKKEEKEEKEEKLEKPEPPKKIEEKKPTASKFFQADNDDDEQEEEEDIEKEKEAKPEEIQKEIEKPKIDEKSKKSKKKGKKEEKEEEEVFENEKEENEENPAENNEKLTAVEQEKKDKKKEKRKAKKEAQKNPEKKETVVESKKDDKKPKKMTVAAKIALEKMNKIKEEEERIRLEEEERKRLEELELQRLLEEERVRKEAEERRRKVKEDKIDKMKKEGTYMNKKQREKIQEDLIKRKQLEEMGILPNIEKEVIEVKEVAPKKKFVKKKNELEELEKKLREKELQTIAKIIAETKEATNNDDEKKEAIAEDWLNLAENESSSQKPFTDPTDESSKNNTEKPQESQSNSDKKSKIDKKSKKDENLSGQIQPPVEGSIEEVKTESTSITTNPVTSSNFELRSPICCILGHVDTGKTTILDRIRNTNVQEGEAGGITQQIGATFFPAYKLNFEIEKLKSFYDIDCSVPGLLIIDTPGHESFSNLRSRGSSLCDIAILVIDLMHGIEKQTLESLELLKMRKTPFIVALNKIDRNYGWKTFKNESSYLSLQKQDKASYNEFKKRLDGIITELAEKGFNAALYWENPDVSSYVSLVPTSGITGEGLSDLLGVILKYSSKFLRQKIKMLGDVFDCTVLEVKMIEGLGTTIDVILVNGELRESDKIVLMGFQGPIVTTIRALLTPHPMKEMRVKNEYLHHKHIHASMGVKISANDLETAVAGSHLYVAACDEEISGYSRELQADWEGVRKRIELVNQGVCVAASTLGSLEALLQFLKTSKIPVAHIGVGPVSKEDVTKSLKAILADDDKKKKKEFATVLAFDVKILPEAQIFADQNGIKIFTANIIYHLFDQFMAYVNEIREERKKEEGKDAVFPCILKTVAFINKKDPLILGVDVVKGVLKLGTPLCVYDQSKLKIGIVESIELNKKPLKEALPASGSVAIRIKGDTNITAGRHFDANVKFVSMLTRNSLDLLKEYFRDEMSKSDWDLARDLKPYFQIY